MFRAELQKYLRSRWFWISQMGNIAFALLFALKDFYFNTARYSVIDGYMHASGSLSLFWQVILPLVAVLFAGYLICSEYGWGTLRLYFFEGVERVSVARVKFVMMLFSLLSFALSYYIVVMTLSVVLFGLSGILIADRVMPAGEVILRLTASYVWGVVLIGVFAGLAQVFSLQLRGNLGFATFSALGTFYFVMLSGAITRLPLLEYLTRPGREVLRERLLTNEVGLAFLKGAVLLVILYGLVYWVFRRQFQKMDILLT
jgi:ABC-type transport system involved in multi-copper enzyme maturation permease subunit